MADRQNNKTQLTVAIIGAVAVIIAAIIGLGQPIVEKWAEARFSSTITPTGNNSSENEASFDVQRNVWYLMRLEAQRERIHVYIDGNLLLSIEDDGLKEGGINQFITGPETTAQFDDVRVWALGQ